MVSSFSIADSNRSAAVEATLRAINTNFVCPGLGKVTVSACVGSGALAWASRRHVPILLRCAHRLLSNSRVCLSSTNPILVICHSRFPR